MSGIDPPTPDLSLNDERDRFIGEFTGLKALRSLVDAYVA
jgi:hypothetical protein